MKKVAKTKLGFGLKQVSLTCLFLKKRCFEEGRKNIPKVRTGVNVIKLFSVGNLDVGIYPKILKVF